MFSFEFNDVRIFSKTTRQRVPQGQEGDLYVAIFSLFLFRVFIAWIVERFVNLSTR